MFATCQKIANSLKPFVKMVLSIFPSPKELGKDMIWFSVKATFFTIFFVILNAIRRFFGYPEQSLVANVVNKEIDKVKDLCEDTTEGIKNAAENAVHEIGSNISEIGQAIDDKLNIGKNIQHVQDAGKNLVNEFHEATEDISKLAESTKNKLLNVGETVSDARDAVHEKTKELAEGLLSFTPFGHKDTDKDKKEDDKEKPHGLAALHNAAEATKDHLLNFSPFGAAGNKADAKEDHEKESVREHLSSLTSGLFKF